jgi:DNA-binding NarL/FixJ family response regulator
MSGHGTTSTVFLLDDHEMVREGLKVMLEASGRVEVVGESGSAEDAVRRIPQIRPDVAILDARLPDGSGIDVCRASREADPGLRALILTSYDDDEALFTAIAAGACGYLLKNVKVHDFVNAIERVSAGQGLIDPVLKAKALTRMRGGPPPASELAKLSEQELRVLALLGEGLTNRQIGERMLLAEKTVKNYVSHVLGKLGLERRTQAAVLATRLHATASVQPSLSR